MKIQRKLLDNKVFYHFSQCITAVDGELKESREAEKQERGGGGVGECKSTLILTPMSRPFNFSTSFSTKIKIKTKRNESEKGGCFGYRCLFYILIPKLEVDVRTEINTTRHRQRPTVRNTRRMSDRTRSLGVHRKKIRPFFCSDLVNHFYNPVLSCFRLYNPSWMGLVRLVGHAWRTKRWPPPLTW